MSGPEQFQYKIRTPPKMFKRPLPIIRHGPRVFVTEIRPDGTRESSWKYVACRGPPVPSGHPSRVGEIMDKMRQPQQTGIPITNWVPSVHYEFIASTMHPDSAKIYIQKSEAWFQANPPRAISIQKTQTKINTEPIINLYNKYGTKRPPLEPWIEAVRKAGYPEYKIEKGIAYYKWLEDTVDERQKALDKIFAKYPAASKPTKTAKVIKAVKKKMT